MSTGRPWLAWYPADIFNDPKYIVLSRSAKLTYRELLDRCWLAGAVLPPDPRKLAALAGMEQAAFDSDWAEMQDPADPCFITHPVISGFLTNKRIWGEWVKAEEQAAKARDNGKKGGRPPLDNTAKKTDAVSSGLAKQNPEKSSSQSQSHKEKGGASPPLSGKGRTATVPHQEIIALYHEVLPELPRVVVWTDYRQAMLRLRWGERAERQDLEWWRGYFERVRQCPLLMGQKGNFRATLEWLVRPKNMPKVLEGNYRDKGGDLFTSSRPRNVYDALTSAR